MEKLRDQLLELVDRIDDGYNSKGVTVTGVPTLEYLPNSSLTVLAGRPVSGKTKVLAHLIRELAIHNSMSVTLMHFRQNPVELLSRIMSDGDTLYEAKIRHAALEDDDWGTLIKDIDELKDSSLQILDGTNLHSWSEAVEQVKATEPEIVLLDDWSSWGSDENSHLMFQKITTGQLKELAVEIDAPVVVTATTSRESVKREDKRPMAVDLDHYSGIFHDADQITGLYRPSVYEDNYDGEELIEMNQILGGHPRCRRNGELAFSSRRDAV